MRQLKLGQARPCLEMDLVKAENQRLPGLDKELDEAEIEQHLEYMHIEFLFTNDNAKWRIISKEEFMNIIVSEFEIGNVLTTHKKIDNWIGSLGNYKAQYIYRKFFELRKRKGQDRDFLTAKDQAGPIDVIVEVYNFKDWKPKVELSRRFYRTGIIDCSVQ
jgi:hypothetical protein